MAAKNFTLTDAIETAANFGDMDRAEKAGRRIMKTDKRVKFFELCPIGASFIVLAYPHKTEGKCLGFVREAI